MNDPHTEDQNQSDPRDDREFPEWPVPQEPYLEPPLETNPVSDVIGEKPEEAKSEPERALTVQKNLEQPERQEQKPSHFGEHPANSSLHQATQEIQVFHSPYFPRGIYEDAQSVEAFYGRGEPKPGYSPFSEPGKVRSKLKFPDLYKPILLVIAALLVLILLFSSVFGNLSLSLF